MLMCWAHEKPTYELSCSAKLQCAHLVVYFVLYSCRLTGTGTGTRWLFMFSGATFSAVSLSITTLLLLLLLLLTRFNILDGICWWCVLQNITDQTKNNTLVCLIIFCCCFLLYLLSFKKYRFWYVLRWENLLKNCASECGLNCVVGVCSMKVTQITVTRLN